MGKTVVEDQQASGEDNADVPPEFRCPITLGQMTEPVVATDGHTYELKAIKKWLHANHTSPITGRQLENKTLIFNHNLKKLMVDFPPSFTGTKRKIDTEVEEADASIKASRRK